MRCRLLRDSSVYIELYNAYFVFVFRGGFVGGVPAYDTESLQTETTESREESVGIKEPTAYKALQNTERVRVCP